VEGGGLGRIPRIGVFVLFDWGLAVSVAGYKLVSLQLVFDFRR
jgi:hypothetical protein